MRTVRGILRPVASRLDRLTSFLLVRSTPNLEEPLPQAVHRELQRLRFPLYCGLLLLIGTILMGVFAACKGWYLLYVSDPPQSCQPLMHWLLGYCVAVTMLPFCAAVAVPLVIWWAAQGTGVRAKLPDSCREEASPDLWSFADMVLNGTVLATVFIILAALMLSWVRRRMSQLRSLWGPGGPASEAAIERIVEEAAEETAPDGTECCICLEEGNDRGTWLRLVCNHYFHDPCLREWLRSARACPLCRLDLHAAYLIPPDQRPASDNSQAVSPAQNDIENPPPLADVSAANALAVALLGEGPPRTVPLASGPSAAPAATPTAEPDAEEDATGRTTEMTER